MKIGAFVFGWFDLVVLAVITLGVLQGRKRGMSEELLDVLQWLAIVVLCGMLYEPIGRSVAAFTNVRLLTAYIGSYLFVLITIRLFFSWIKQAAGDKLVGSDLFGGSEFYLGMAAGGVRCACYLMVALALLHAKHITPEQLAATARLQQENFGDISFPTIGSLQQSVFAGSFSGSFVKTHLPDELISATRPDVKTAQTESIGRQRERAVDEVMGEKR
jgi:uncharacterized membrane protein required for colicin V production